MLIRYFVLLHESSNGAQCAFKIVRETTIVGYNLDQNIQPKFVQNNGKICVILFDKIHFDKTRMIYLPDYKIVPTNIYFPRLLGKGFSLNSAVEMSFELPPLIPAFADKYFKIQVKKYTYKVFK